MFVIAALLLASSYHALMIPLQDGQHFCVSDDYAEKTLVMVQYRLDVMKNQTDRSAVQVRVEVTDTAKNKLFSSQKTSDGNFSFQVQNVGEHELCFSLSPRPRGKPRRTMYMTLKVKVGYGTEEEQLDPKTDRIPVNYLRKLESQMHLIQSEQNYYKQRHTRLMDNEKDNSRRVQLMYFIQIIVVVVCGYLQMKMFMRFLKQRKIL
ncbi:MAG: hypothetical protein EZS28_009026 [Streblomastix strix]|uniref:GOLD domain-containing protein n=1 Tax=Streblomastix strix TaxID=222440 RepID=A0A5J4WM40_9EUKA|nr:MAG: hypothetical protein EZS28_009026 [Streblomastix strix]